MANKVTAKYRPIYVNFTACHTVPNHHEFITDTGHQAIAQQHGNKLSEKKTRHFLGQHLRTKTIPNRHLSRLLPPLKNSASALKP